ncbi:hypothetical protein CspeluHIS016_0307140 [Cutaneotrichosporon spelunceum]|uniref:PH domain-containing protein n=1 Tax=Cutaneotrichosporon spelunceum TaxID=1672016 RepID=A0AAD3YCI5_9TREE|nr:hypothetical protein CspeluHIS016_0307140 [Cutaneotrichosporon spelunceum]
MIPAHDSVPAPSPGPAIPLTADATIAEPTPTAPGLAIDTNPNPIPPTATPPVVPLVSALAGPPLTVDDGPSPASSPFHTPSASVVFSPETHFATGSERDSRVGIDPFALARRRGSAVSAMSAVSAVSAISAGSVGSPRRMPPVLHAPPMPMPIANLPSLNPGGASPGWGTLALQSPALSRTNSRASGSFPFPTDASMSRNNSKDLTDAEVRRATKIMPVILRVPSRQPPELKEEEDDDEDDDAEHESAGGHVSAPPPAHSTYATGVLMHHTMEAVTEESRSGTPLPGSGTAGSASFTTLEPSQSISSSADDTSSSVDVVSPPWPNTDSPEAQEAADDSSVEDSFDLTSVDDHLSGSAAQTTTFTPSPIMPPQMPNRPQLYTRMSQSMMNLPTSQGSFSGAPPDGLTNEPEMDDDMQATTPALDHNSPHPPPHKRRLSAGDADPAPPKYESVHLDHNAPVVTPREEEGHERLPPYWCGVHIEGTLSRKMEFAQPGVQARDRAWKKYYFVLHGTALFVYKYDPTKVPLRMGEPYLTADENESCHYLHVHLAPDHHRASATPSPVPAVKPVRRTTVVQEAAPRINSFASALRNARRSTIGSKTPTRQDQAPGTKDPALFDPPRRRNTDGDSVASSTASAPIASHMPFAHNQLMHVFSMQGAESGLAADYKKRMHCVRVRADGQQFMLQTDTARQCVQWIEAFQAAANVSLDLDTRPMPIQQTLPRRRRRRRAQPASDPNAVPTSDDANTAFADTPEGNLAAVVAAERAENERNRMLAEDQAAADGRFVI